jgi:hypothetical protein
VYWRATTLGAPRVLDGEQQEAVIQVAGKRRYGTTRVADGRSEYDEATE